MEELLQDTTLTLLENTKLGQAVKIVNKVQENLAALDEKQGEAPLTTLKCGTLITLAIFEKMRSGVSPKNLSKKDWADIARAVSDMAICNPDQVYSKFVFRQYADYIEASASIISDRVSPNTVASIRGNAAELKALAQRLDIGEISEAAYIDQSLWLCLEAIIKLLAAMVQVAAGEEAEQLAQAVAAYAFEYGRYKLLQKEHIQLTDFLEQQEKLDAALQEQYDAYLKELKAEENQFLGLMNQAFDADFSELLQNSVQLAHVAGVDDHELLHTIQETDDYFLK